MSEEKLNIRKLLRGTQYESRADAIASKIEDAGYDNASSIENLAQVGSKVAGVNVNELLWVIREQMEAQADQVDSDVVEKGDPEPEDEEPDWLKASDAAVRLAGEQGIDLSDVNGTGSGGLITVSDVRRFMDS